MKKRHLIILLVFIMAVVLAGCQPSVSTDEYGIMNIFTKNRIITYARTENDNEAEVVYDITVEGDLVSTSTVINFDFGQFTSDSVFNAKTLIPVSAHKGNSYNLDPSQNWNIYAEYGALLNMTAETAEETERKSIDLPERYIDNEALLFTMGALYYEEGFEKDINVSIIDAGEVVTFKVSYQGTEDVEVPYGTIECIKVEIKYTGIVLGAKPKMYVWYTNDDERIPVMYENRDIFLKLKSVD